MKVWEWTEPGIWSVWGYRVEYQGRDNFEGGWIIGVAQDIEDGMEGYEIGSGILIGLSQEDEW